MTERGARLQKVCTCAKVYASQKKPAKRQRNICPWIVDKEVWCPKYMMDLSTNTRIPCEDAIELPWQDISLPITSIQILGTPSDLESQYKPEAGYVGETREAAYFVEEEEAANGMTLPWEDLLIMQPVTAILEDPAAEICDSSLEIPWADLTLEKPIVIQPPRMAPCPPEQFEMPWNEIVMASNIVIKAEKRRKHPSSNRSSRASRESNNPVTTCFKKSALLATAM